MSQDERKVHQVASSQDAAEAAGRPLENLLAKFLPLLLPLLLLVLVAVEG